jgi:hypothetical protein
MGLLRLASRVRAFTRYAPGRLVPAFDDPHVKMLHLHPPIGLPLLIVAAHLPSKLRGDDEDQGYRIRRLRSDIEAQEARSRHQNTLVIGDLNVNPFEDALTAADGLHGVMDKPLANRPARVVQGSAAGLSKDSRFGQRIEHALAAGVRDGGACPLSVSPFRKSTARYGVWIGLCLCAEIAELQRSPRFCCLAVGAGTPFSAPQARTLLGDLMISACSAQKAVATRPRTFAINPHPDSHRYSTAGTGHTEQKKVSSVARSNVAVCVMLSGAMFVITTEHHP